MILLKYILRRHKEEEEEEEGEQLGAFSLEISWHTGEGELHCADGSFPHMFTR